MNAQERTLRARRTDPDARRFDPRFFEKHRLFWPIAAAASVFQDGSDWPPVEEYARAFRGAVPPVSFEPARPKPRRWRRQEQTVDLGSLYDGRIVHSRCVPTRPRSWHDFLNALVWATFPAAKAALHARQHRAMAEHVPAAATRLPNARTRELDALAMIDEGAVIVCGASALDPGPTADHGASALDLGRMADQGRRHLVFGHALYEGLVLGSRAMIARALVLPIHEWASSPRGDAGSPVVDLAHIDTVMAARLSDFSRPILPEGLPRLALDSVE